MGQELVKIFDWDETKLFYGTTNIVFTAATDRIGITGIGTASPAGTRLNIATAEDAANDGVWEVSSVVDANTVAVGEGGTITGNADDDTAVIRGETNDGWKRVDYYSRIVGIVSSDQDVTVKVQWAVSETGTSVTVSTAVTGGTPASIASEVLGKYVRIRVINNDTSTATLSGTFYAKALT